MACLGKNHGQSLCDQYSTQQHTKLTTILAGLLQHKPITWPCTQAFLCLSLKNMGRPGYEATNHLRSSFHRHQTGSLQTAGG